MSRWFAVGSLSRNTEEGFVRVAGHGGGSAQYDGEFAGGMDGSDCGGGGVEAMNKGAYVNRLGKEMKMFRICSWQFILASDSRGRYRDCPISVGYRGHSEDILDILMFSSHVLPKYWRGWRLRLCRQPGG